MADKDTQIGSKVSNTEHKGKLSIPFLGMVFLLFPIK